MPISNYPAPRFPIGNSQWRYTATGGETTLSGYDVSGTPMAYVVNSEQVFQNGVMLVRNVDYTASTGTSVVLNNALAAGDFVEILTYSNFNVATLPSGSITGLIQNSQLQNNSLVLGSVSAPLGSTVSSLTGVTIDGVTNTIHTNRGATNPVTGQVVGDLFWNTTSSALQLWNGSAWISFAPPAAPTIGTATDVGTGRAFNNAAATVTFTPNNTGGTAAQYFVTSAPGGLTSYGYSSPITITGLTTSTQYTFTVTAQGSFGNSNASSSTGSLTVTSVPQAPTIGTVTQSVNSVSIPFTANGTGGKTITGYTVTSSSGVTATGTTSPISLSETNNGNYTYTITATNANGTSASSSPSNSLAFAFIPTVSGGSLASDTTYYYRTFTGNGNLSVTNAALTADILTIAGGGGASNAGGSGAGAGGGAGGVVYSASQPLPVSTYSVTVGGGGAAGANTAATPGNQGNLSKFGSLTTAAGGGYGGACYSPTTSVTIGGTGGSGGGGGVITGGGAQTNYGSGTNGQGSNGGNGSQGAGNDCGGAGGGDGGSPSNAVQNSSVTGGPGTSAYSSWGVATGYGQNISGTYYFAGGGAGGAQSLTAANGGNGGGGAVNTSGTNYTGGGGGGQSGSVNSAGNGGSGIVIVRYTRAQVGG